MHWTVLSPGNSIPLYHTNRVTLTDTDCVSHRNTDNPHQPTNEFETSIGVLDKNIHISKINIENAQEINNSVRYMNFATLYDSINNFEYKFKGYSKSSFKNTAFIEILKIKPISPGWPRNIQIWVEKPAVGATVNNMSLEALARGTLLILYI